MTELTHAGVKGMKWGVRKDRESSSKPKRTPMSDETKTRLKKAAIIGGSVVAAGLISYGVYKLGSKPEVVSTGRDLVHKMRLGDRTTKDFMRKDPRVRYDSEIPENSVFSTLAKQSSIDRGRTFYATLSGKDKVLYRRDFSNELSIGEGDIPIFSNGTVNSKKLKVAGLKTAEKLYREYTGNPKSEVAHWHFSRPYSDRVKHDEFLDFMKTKGYSAMVDYLDVGYGSSGSSAGATKPLIVFGDKEFIDAGSHLVEKILKNA